MSDSLESRGPAVYYICDGCGKEVPSASGLMVYAVISTINAETGMVENLHLCRKPVTQPDGETGCMEAILSAEALPFRPALPTPEESDVVAYEPANPYPEPDHDPTAQPDAGSGDGGGSADSDPVLEGGAGAEG